jgi:ATP-binding cassette, subfamily D (ALD), peroxisomal long-chain fatty acid import protein
MKYHTHLLHLSGDGTGAWTMRRVGTAEERMGIDREIVALGACFPRLQRFLSGPGS